MEMIAKVYTRTNDNGIHYARIIVPKQLRAFVAKPALWRSLATKNDKEAMAAGALVAAASQLVFQEVSDANLDAVVVEVATNVVNKEIDLMIALDGNNSEDLDIVSASLRKSLRLKNGGSGGGNMEPDISRQKTSVKSKQ